MLDLVPEFTIIESSGNSTSVRPGILVKAYFIENTSRKHVIKEYHYESERIISDASLAGACIKIRRSFEYYDAHLAGMQSAVHLWN